MFKTKYKKLTKLNLNKCLINNKYNESKLKKLECIICRWLLSYQIISMIFLCRSKRSQLAF